GNVLGGGPVALQAGRDIVVDEGTEVSSSLAGNGITATAGRNISVQHTTANGATIETGSPADISLTTGPGGTSTRASASGGTGDSSRAGNTTISADNMVTNARINAGTGIVTLQTKTAGTAINLGGADAAGTLGLTDAELDRVEAGTLVIGRNDASASGT